MATNFHVSTLALSVYNVIVRFGQKTPAHILSELLEQWSNTVNLAEVEAGIAYLAERDFVTNIAGVIVPKYTKSGVATPVFRDPTDLTELRLGHALTTDAQLGLRE